jgi:hypothetical protein
MTWEDLARFIKPELLVLVPVLYFLGMALKKSKRCDEKIPLILGAFGIILSAVSILSLNPITGFQEVMGAIFMAVTQGILAAGCSVYVNQIVKQRGKDIAKKLEAISNDIKK